MVQKAQMLPNLCTWDTEYFFPSCFACENKGFTLENMSHSRLSVRLQDYFLVSVETKRRPSLPKRISMEKKYIASLWQFMLIMPAIGSLR